MRLRSLLLILLLVICSPLIIVFGPAVGITVGLTKEMLRGGCHKALIVLLIPFIFTLALVLTPLGYAIAIPIVIGVGIYKLSRWIYRRIRREIGDG
jgi:hypothetical protein